MAQAQESKQHVLHVIDQLAYGGAQQLLVLLAAFSRTRCRTTVCALQPPGDLKEALEAAGARVLLLNRERPGIATPGKFFSYVGGGIRDIIGYCRKERVDVIHCHLSDAEFLGVAAARLAGVRPVLVTAHTPKLLPKRPWYDPRNALRRLATMVLFNLADRILAVSEETAEALHTTFGVAQKRLAVMQNGIDVEYYASRPASPERRASLGIPPDAKVVVAVGRLVPLKGHEYLVQALPRLRERFGDVRLILLGDGERRGALEALCRESGTAGHVIFAGNRRDVADILAFCDVFAMPSLWEGTSLALLEAMAGGRAIVATDIPGNRKVLTPDEDALLVPPEDSAALAEAVGRFLADPALAEAFGGRARRTAEAGYDIKIMVAELEKLWGAAP